VSRRLRAPGLLALFAAAAALAASPARADDSTVSSPKIRSKPAASSTPSDSTLQPDTDVVDAPTSSVLDYGGYSTRSRFYSDGGLLEYVSFGVYPGVNLGASAAIDGLIGNEKEVRVRAPAAQIRWRFYDGSEYAPSLAVGYDGQGYLYSQANHWFNERQRGAYVVASKEIGAPGLDIHPSINVSDFNSNAVFGSLPLTYNIRDKAEILAEWDNIGDRASDSRVNLGLRVFVTPSLDVDFAVRSVGTGGYFSDGQPRGPERIVQIKYTGNF
jgi:hypothetical protein